MDEFKLLCAFNVILLVLIIWPVLSGRVKWYVHLPVFVLYNGFFAYRFLYDGQYGQGFAWVFLNAIFSVLHFVILCVIFFIKKRK
jgi:hypothetical protein